VQHGENNPPDRNAQKACQSIFITYYLLLITYYLLLPLLHGKSQYLDDCNLFAIKDITETACL
jgi:hypothetical protein